ncbi:MAG: AzlD domain-containing protein [Gammaproteobacteria bacterium]|nr:AzlD domain-containing protein [Gammaproteobacteria bacterium]
MSEALLLACGIGATYVWRGLGVAFSARIEPESAMFRWVNCVSHAMLAGLISRMVVLPLGSIAEAPLEHRLIAMAVAFAVFYLARNNWLLGVVAGVGTFMALVA